MKFIKHFTDADEGTLHDLMNQLGVEAYGRYWLLAELCAKELKKGKDEFFEESDFIFTFNLKQIRDKLRIKSKHLQIFLTSCSDLSLFQLIESENKVKIFFPKLAECLDRDSKRARTKRGSSAGGPGQDKEEYNKEKDKEEYIKDFHFDLVVQQFPIKNIGDRAKELFFNQVKTQTTFEALAKAILNYREELISNPSRIPKSSFASFLDRNSHTGEPYWIQWIDPKSGHAELYSLRQAKNDEERKRRNLELYGTEEINNVG